MARGSGWVACLLLVAACGRGAAPAPDPFEAAVRTYLAKRGALCLGKSAWPIDVPVRHARTGDRDALQMPVLERLGLVRGTDMTVDMPDDHGVVPTDVRRYELTDAGRQYYLARERGRGASGEPLHEKSDFCVARLSLDKIVRTDVKGGDAGPREATVAYTYTVDAPPWARDPEFQTVLPAVARVLDGAGTAQLTESFTWTRDGWVAHELLGDGQAPN
jgi:hypothetical protein